jgi:hypothetical protein
LILVNVLLQRGHPVESIEVEGDDDARTPGQFGVKGRDIGKLAVKVADLWDGVDGGGSAPRTLGGARVREVNSPVGTDTPRNRYGLIAVMAFLGRDAGELVAGVDRERVRFSGYPSRTVPVPPGA